MLLLKKSIQLARPPLNSSIPPLNSSNLLIERGGSAAVFINIMLRCKDIWRWRL
jgi:hypothetical protein